MVRKTKSQELLEAIDLRQRVMQAWFWKVGVILLVVSLSWWLWTAFLDIATVLGDSVGYNGHTAMNFMYMASLCQLLFIIVGSALWWLVNDWFDFHEKA